MPFLTLEIIGATVRCSNFVNRNNQVEGYLVIGFPRQQAES